MKKLIALLLTGCAAVGMLTGCGSTEDASADQAAVEESAVVESDLEYVTEKGVLVVGITDFAPMDYKDESGEWVGFDAEMAAAFAESLTEKQSIVYGMG